MPTIDRQDSVLNILQNLHDVDGLKRLFWEELNYERENRPLSPRQWPESARQPLAEDPILFASGGEDNAFHVVYCRLESDALFRGHERPVVNRLTREHPYALFVFSNKGRTNWHFLNVKYDEEADKRRLLRRITVRPGLPAAPGAAQAGEGLRTAAERLQMLDLEAISPNLLARRSLSGEGGFALSPLTIQQRHDAAFDVEKVSKDFYREIANWYFWALKHVKFPKDAPKEQDGRDHISVIRFITRLIFCWFIREKGLIPNVLFDEARLAEMLDGFAPGKKGNKDSVFYRAILQNLFFATLNTEMDQRGWRRPGQNLMAHSLYRHKECFRDPKAGLEWFKDIPFLNGGLFECLDRDFGEGARPRYLRVDGFSDRDDSRPTAPDFLFFGSEQDVDLSEDYGDKKFRSVRVRGLIDTLNRYKFTIEENTPFDQEVALDPELCGKVFENLLAAYNPETGTTARKATGSFYTPREIVDYMVEESLVAYIRGRLVDGVDKVDGGGEVDRVDARLRALLSYDADGPKFGGKETEALIEAIDGLKALDPAVGSGAFPMGILHKLVLVLGKLDPDNERWKAKQIAKLDDATMREDAERLFRENYDDYGRKLYLIENCIYGVDIQPIAVQIAKMRFFISLIVDQKVNPKAPNLGVRALPNLETKFVAANTLIGIDRPAQMMLRNPEIDKKEDELRQVRQKHFTTRTLKSKAKCREDDKRLRAEIAELLKNDGWDNTTAKQLAAWDPYDQNAHAEFFDPEWMFGVTEGFDMVIGNPPYVRQEAIKELKPTFSRHYECYTGVADLYVYFYEQAVRLLANGGVLSFISSNKWYRAGYGEKLRQYLAKQMSFHRLIDFGDAPVFTAIAYPTIVVAQKAKADNVPITALNWNPAWPLDDLAARLQTDTLTLAPSDLKPDGWRIENPASLRLLEKLRKAGTPLGDYVKGRFYRGVLTGLNEAFVVDRATRDRLIAEHPSSAEVLKPFLRGRDVKRWRCEFAEQYLIKIESSENKSHPWSGKPEAEAEKLFAKTYPAIHAWFKSMRAALINRCDQGKYFWELRSCSYWQEFEHPSIIYPDIAQRSEFAFSKDGFYLANTLYLMPISDIWLLAHLNSSIVWWLYNQISNQIRGGFVRFIAQYVSQISIPPATPAQQRELESLVSRILTAKAADPTADTSAWEREIDERVYKLYGLMAEEIKIVEGEKK